LTNGIRVVVQRLNLNSPKIDHKGRIVISLVQLILSMYGPQIKQKRKGPKEIIETLRLYVLETRVIGNNNGVVLTRDLLTRGKDYKLFITHVIKCMLIREWEREIVAYYCSV